MDYAALWQRLDALICARALRASKQLRRPATAAGLAWLHAQARKGGASTLDAALEATYAAHDGARGESPSFLALLSFPEEAAWATACAWHSSWDARAELATWQDAIGRDPQSDEDDDTDDRGWPSIMLPIARDGGGNAIAASLDSGELLAFDHEVGEFVSIGFLGEFLVTLERDLRDGKIGDDERGEFTRDDRVLATATAVRDLAESFCSLLVEKRLANVSATPALRDAIRPLLDIKSSKTRVKRLVALLYDHEDVSEVFADDEVLALMIEEFG